MLPAVHRSLGVVRRAPMLRPGVLAAAIGMALGAMVPTRALAHGDAAVEPSPEILIQGWSLDVAMWLPVLLAGLIYWKAVDIVDRHHPANPVPRWRLWSWMLGLAVILLALASPIERYDTTLFSVHMIQHLLLVMVAASLLVMAAPVTLLLRVSTPGARKRWILPVLNSRPARVLSTPVVAWGLFAAVMWWTHFSPLFDAALEDPLVHRLEHMLFISTALLFWWPVIGADPNPHRMDHPGRIFYLALGMPLSSLLGLVIFSARVPLYEHYETLERTWGLSPMEDQAWAGGIMWVLGDLVFVIALVLAVSLWLRHEEREGERVDARLARERAARARATQ
jgi:putative copper resistance protein D